MKSLRPHVWPEIEANVLAQQLTNEALCTQLSALLEQTYPPDARKSGSIRSKYHDAKRSIGYLANFLNADAQQPVLFNEMTLYGGMVPFLMGQNLDLEDARRHALNLRRLVNGLPSTLRIRDLLDHQGYQRGLRYHRLDRQTQEMMKWFFAKGCKIKKGKLTQQLLTEGFRKDALDLTVKFLERSNLVDIRIITEGHADAYVNNHVTKGGDRDTALNTLADIRSFFENLVLNHYLTSNPFHRYTSKKTKFRNDYLTPEVLRNLMDLTDIDPDDFLLVRDLLIVIGLYYDFSCRLSEPCHLDLSHVDMTDLVELTLPGPAQKGSDKPEVTLFNCFPETRTLFDAYLRLRSRIPCKTDALLVSTDGERLLESGCDGAVERICTRKGIRTRDGRIPSAHDLRHTFGTLNMEPLGRFSLTALGDRLRHANYTITKERYVTNNRELQRLRHVQRMNRGAVRGSVSQNADTDSGLMSEREAKLAVESMGITLPALRKDATTHGYLVTMNGERFFRRDAIHELVTEWVPKAWVMKQKRYSKSGFFDFIDRNGFKHRQIGKVGLYRIRDVMGQPPSISVVA